MGSHYNYTSDDHSEYLLIVSKEYGANDHINETDGSSDKRKVSLQTSMLVGLRSDELYHHFVLFRKSCSMLEPPLKSLRT